MRNVLLLNLCTCKHLDSGLLDVLKLTGALIIEVAGPRVDSYLGLGSLPCLDFPHDLVPSVVLMSDLLLRVSVQRLAFPVKLLSSGTLGIVGNLDDDDRPRGGGEHGLGVQLRLVGLPTGFSSIYSTSTSLL
jgi:hypothetical protein